MFIDRISNWWAGCLAYTQPTWKLVLSYREQLFLRTAEAISIQKPHGMILDLGTGTGRLPLLTGEVAQNISFVGVDLNRILINQAQRQSFRKRLDSRVSFVMANIEALPFSDLAFDMIVSVASLHQWHNREKCIKEAYRILKSGGTILIFVDPNLMWLFDFLNRKFTNQRNLKRLFTTIGFKDVVTIMVGVPSIGDFTRKKQTLPPSDVLLIFGRK